MDKKEFLFRLIKDRKRLDHSGKYILFIGAGASLSSGASLFYDIFASLGVKDYDEFCIAFESLSESERYTLLHDHLIASTPSKATKQLAQLLKDGYFDTVITTNFDNLIERSLQQIGLTSNDFEVVVNTADSPIKSLSKVLSYKKPRIKIVKLHGDFLKREFAITKKETIQFKSQLEGDLRKLLSLNDTLIIGSEFSDLDLLRSMELEGGSIWYINPKEPEHYLKALMSHRKCEENYISAEGGKFDSFINELHRFLTGIEESSFEGEWLLLAPFCPVVPYEETDIQFLENPKVSRKEDRVILDFSKSVKEQLHLHWFDSGIGVWVLKNHIKYVGIYEFAIERRRIYKQILRGNHLVSNLTSHIKTYVEGLENVNGYSSGVGYCFSLLNITEPAWDDRQVKNAMKLLSCPSMFYDRYVADELQIDVSAEVLESLSHAETGFLNKGIDHVDFCSFSVDRSVEGFASWAGLAMHGMNDKGQRQFQDILDYEINLQAYWWYLHHFKDLLVNGHETYVTERYKRDKVSRTLSKLVSIGPTETTTSRLYKEAIIKTSRILNHYKDFKELL